MAAMRSIEVDCPVDGCDTKMDVEVELVARPALRRGEYSVEVLTDLGGVVQDHFAEVHAG